MATSSSEMTDKEKADIEVIMEVAKSVAPDVKSQNAATGSVIRNNRGRFLRLYATHSWNGSFQSNPAGSINVGDRIQLMHIGSRDSRPRGAVIYGEDRGGSNPAGYLLAWSMRDRALRVYVKCGPLAEVHSNGWENAALANLNSSGDSSTATDDSTSSRATAQIRDETGSFPFSVVGSAFG